MEVGKAHALVVQPVEVRSLEHRVAVARQVAVALVVGQNEDDVGPAPFERGGVGPRVPISRCDQARIADGFV